MKTIFKSLLSKYIVNVIMIFVFAVSSVTGIFHVGSERPERDHNFRDEQLSSTGSTPDQFAAISEESENKTFAPGLQPRGEENDTHIFFGLFWVGLMVFHIIQNWAWFKKLGSVKHILKNKLTTAITIVFLIMAISGILLWSEIIPRDVINVKEIHDISGKLIFILIIIHIIQRISWYIKIPRKLLAKESITIQ